MKLYFESELLRNKQIIQPGFLIPPKKNIMAFPDVEEVYGKDAPKRQGILT